MVSSDGRLADFRLQGVSKELVKAMESLPWGMDRLTRPALLTWRIYSADCNSPAHRLPRRLVRWEVKRLAALADVRSAETESIRGAQLSAGN